ncbi:Cof-type HAD-IIB family hydrolase [Chloroflexota bacterium]
MIDSKYKLLVIDIDGTLLGKDGTISDMDIDALKQAGDAGVRVSLSTGRVVQASRPIIDYIGLDGYHVFFDGAFVYSPDKAEEVYVNPISEELIRQMMDYAHRIGIDFDLYSDTRFFVERESWATDIRREFFKMIPTVVEFNDICREERLIKGTLVAASDEDKAKAGDFAAHFKDSLSCSWTSTPAYPGIDFINLVNKGVSKGRAMEALVGFLGIDLAEVMAIGDGLNDLTLLSTAGLAVAMEKAPDTLKEIADHVTLDVDNSGVAAAVKKFLL